LKLRPDGFAVGDTAGRDASVPMPVGRLFWVEPFNRLMIGYGRNAARFIGLDDATTSFVNDTPRARDIG
jgi:hypothetical protein